MKKVSLLIQSLSPIAILTIIKIFPINLITLVKRIIQTPFKVFKAYWNHIISGDKVYIVLTFCIISIIWAFISYLFFKDSISIKKEPNYTIRAKPSNEEDSLNFFFFFLFPLIIDDFSTWNGFIFYFTTIIITVLLLWKTTLFYRNPVLTLLGYNIYGFTFHDNGYEPDEELIGICYGKLEEETKIEYKKILNKVYYIKEIENEQK